MVAKRLQENLRENSPKDFFLHKHFTDHNYGLCSLANGHAFKNSSVPPCTSCLVSKHHDDDSKNAQGVAGGIKKGQNPNL